MVKEYGFKYVFRYFYVPQFLIYGLILFILQLLVLPFLTNISFISKSESLRNFTEVCLFLLFLALWLLPFFYSCRSRNYEYLTGRNFNIDTHKFHRTYYELVDYFKDAIPHKLNTTTFPEESWKHTKGIIFGKKGSKLIKIPSDSECNIAVFGPPGSGKTSGIAIPNAISFNGSVLAIDIKGDIFNYCHQCRNIIRFCPDNPDALFVSAHFNPFNGIYNMDYTSLKLYFDSMATILIPANNGSEGSYFTNSARKMFQGITYLLLYKNPATSFPDVIHAILQGNIFDYVKEVCSPECECVPAKELLSSFYGNNEKNIAGAYDTLCTALTPFSSPILDALLTDNGNCISIQTLDNGYDIYLQIAQEHIDAYAPIFTLILQSFSTAFTKRPDSSTGANNRPILMLMDEFPQLTFSYKLINSNLSTLRSKSVICMLIMQNSAQLEYRYDSAGSRSILGNCKHQIILGCNDMATGKMFSELFGTQKVLKVSNSQSSSSNSNNSMGKSIQEAREPIFYPNDFGDLSFDKKMIIYFSGKYCECNKINCYTD